MIKDEVAVIGAGPYGLSVAAHLRGGGVPTRIFGELMSSWREHMPAGMLLKSMPCASNLSAPAPGSDFADYCAEHGIPQMSDDDAIPIEMFVDYGIWFAKRHVADVEDERVVRVVRAGSVFDVSLASGEQFRAPAVVVATGLMEFAHVPPELAALYDPAATDALVTHPSQHPDLSVFAGRRVAILGAGQSALESAALMHEAGAEPLLLVRGRRVVWAAQPDADPTLLDRIRPWSPLGNGFSLRFAHDAPDIIRRLPVRARLALVKNVLGPFGSCWLEDRVVGKVPMRMRCSVTRATAHGDGVRLDLAYAGGGREQLDVDHVLSATGYRVDVDRLTFLDPSLRAQVQRVAGSPILNGAFASTVPNLHFTGLAAASTFGPMLRFVEGAQFAAPRITASISGEAGRAAA